MQTPDPIEGDAALALAESRFHTANSLRERGALREAEAVYRSAISLWPEFLEALNNLGLTLRSQERIPEALACYEAAIAIDPECPEPHLNLALAHLLQGDFERAWPEYEWRLRMPNPYLRQCQVPLWNGKPFQGKTILLHPDQGHGDTIHFVRYAPLVKALGGQVIFECLPALARLLRGYPGIDILVSQGESLPHFDLHAPLLSLPGLFKTTLKDLPCEKHLSAPAELRQLWRMRLEGLRRFRIGISWQGNPKHSEFARRNASVASFCELAKTPGVQLFSLQKGPGSLRNGSEKPNFPLLDLEPELNDFADTAAAIEQLDLVITTDSAVAHLAAALGKPTWVFLQRAADWRWMLKRADSPWYPTMRLFRQETAGDWAPVFRKIAAALPQAMIASVKRTA